MQPDKTPVFTFLATTAFLGVLLSSQVAAGPQDDGSPSNQSDANPNTVVWEGTEGVGTGKHIVFIAGDHEYRGEESLPALARILAKSYGFKCTFIVTTNEETGEIQPGSDGTSTTYTPSSS